MSSSSSSSWEVVVASGGERGDSDVDAAGPPTSSRGTPLGGCMIGAQCTCVCGGICWKKVPIQAMIFIFQMKKVRTPDRNIYIILYQILINTRNTVITSYYSSSIIYNNK